MSYIIPEGFIVIGTDIAPTHYRTAFQDMTGTDTTAAQPWFPTGGAVTILETKVYLFGGTLYLTASATSHSVSVSLLCSDTPYRCQWEGIGYKANVNGQATAFRAGMSNTSDTARQLTAADTTQGSVIRVGGLLVAPTGTPEYTLTPRFHLSGSSAAPTVLAGTTFWMMEKDDYEAGEWG